MGAEQSVVKVSRDVDARAFPGLGIKCVQSDPLDDHVTYDQLFDNLMTATKTAHKKVDVIKHAEAFEQGEKRFEIVTVLDGPKVGSPVDIASRTRYYFYKELGIVYDEDRDPVLHTLRSLGMTRVLKDPLQVEHIRQAVNVFDRRAGEQVADFAGRFLRNAVGRDVTVETRQPSPSMPGQLSVMSESLENDTTMDKLWDSVLEAAKTQSFVPFVNGPPAQEEDDVDGQGGISYTLWFPLDVAKVREAGLPVPENATEMRTRIRIQGSKPAHVLVMQAQTQEFFLLMIEHIILHPDPLRAEFFRLLPTPPGATEEHRKLVSSLLGEALNMAKEG